MRIKDVAGWEKCRKNNGDPYGKAVVDYAERWADLMEARLAASGGSVADVAEKASHDADTEGITGFMYGAAVAVLSQAWERGEELRLWHNLTTQVRGEGERANREGGVLNPAVLVVGS